MKSILISFILLTFGLTIHAQNLNNKLHIVNAEKPILIINDTIIASIDILNKIPSKNISKLDIFKERKLSSTHLFFDKKQHKGIIKAAINYEFKSKSQKELNRFFGLNEANDIYVNGYLIEDKNQTVLVESIIGIEFIKADDFRLKKSVLNIKIE
ncbi:MAG: hypothetical protein ACOH1N_02830 [Lutibacter sp.]